MAVNASKHDGLFCVIMAGGAGTRFWPASTETKPKQLLTLVGDRSLLQMSVDRAVSLVPPERVVVVTNAQLAGPCRAQLPELPAHNIIGEPSRRDTAAAVALATLWVKQHGGKQVAILTADHLISPLASFQKAVEDAVAAASSSPSAIVTFGVVPTWPATGYGYIEVESAERTTKALRFVEKPDAATATDYLRSGKFLWNSGMFVFGVEALIGALGKHLPTHLEKLTPVVMQSLKDEAAFATAFSAVPKISIDKGVMEKHTDVLCVPARFSWSDVGSFPALAEHLPKDAHGNAHRGTLHTLDATNNVVWCEDGSEEVAVVGVDDVVVVRAGKRTLVVLKSRAEEVKKLVESLPPK